MSMEINNTYGNYTTAANNTSKKESTSSETKQYNNVDEYSKYLSEKYDYFGKQSSVYGVPTSVTVSSSFLQKCVDDPEKAEWLERNLTAYAESTKWANSYTKSLPGAPTRVFQHLTIDENGNMTSCSRTTNDPDGKIAKANAEKKAKAKREEAARLEKKRAEKKEREEQLAEIRAKRKEHQEGLQTHDIKVVGDDIWDLTKKTVEAMSRVAVSGTVGIDIRV